MPGHLAPAPSLNATARLAGFLYLLDAVAAPVRLIYVPSQVIVAADPGATAGNVVAHELLFRIGIVSDLFCGVVEIFLVLALYRLLRRVDRARATLMVILGLMTVPLFFVNVLNDSAVLVLAKGTVLVSQLTEPVRIGLVSLFLHLHRQELLAASIFYGLWLFPLAALVVRSGFLPRFLGLWLAASGVAYLALSVAGFVVLQYESTVSVIAIPAQLGEVAVLLWLLIFGANGGPRKGTPRAAMAY